jgi:hypothetical protein
MGPLQSSFSGSSSVTISFPREIGLGFRVVHGNAEADLITPQARLLWLINAMFPSVVCKDFEPSLPRTARTRWRQGDKLKCGWESQYLVAPSNTSGRPPR